MKSKTLQAALALALVASLGGAALAQDAPRVEPEPAGETVEVEFAGFGYTLAADEPVKACVTSREDALAATTVRYRLFVRELDGSFSSVGVYPSEAIGALANSLTGDCLPLDGFADAS